MDIDDFPYHPFRARDAASLGLSQRQVQRGTEQGLLRRVLHGAYLRTDRVDSVDLRAQIAAMVVEPHHVAVDRTAAWLHGVDAHTFSEHDLLPRIETCAFRGCNPTSRPELRGRSRDLLPRDVGELAGITLTTPLRTALDVGCHLRRREAFPTMSALMRLHGLGTDALARELPRYRGRRGVIQCRELVALVDPRFESPREAWTYLAILDAGLPRPRPQYWVEIDGVAAYRLDLAYQAARVCVEYDGEEFHDRTPDQRRDDEVRRAWLRGEGWRVIVVRRGDFTGDKLERWLRELREALEPDYTNRRW